MKSFIAKGRFSALMEKFPVHIIMHQQPALYGAARLGLEMLD
jgi:glucokinase